MMISLHFVPSPASKISWLVCDTTHWAMTSSALPCAERLSSRTWTGAYVRLL